MVPLSSAVHPQAQTELVINASHTAVHRAPEAIAEIWTILKAHAEGVSRSSAAEPEHFHPLKDERAGAVPPEPTLSAEEAD